MKFLFPKVLGFVAPSPMQVPVEKSQDQQVSDLLNEAANLLEENGWCKGRPVNYKGEMCLMGAILTAGEEDIRKFCRLPSHYQEAMKPITALATKRVEEILGTGWIESWNDHLKFAPKLRAKRVLRKAAKLTS